MQFIFSLKSLAALLGSAIAAESLSAYTTLTEVDSYGKTITVPVAHQSFLPDWVATGVEVTPTIKNSTAPDSQDECPGYELSGISTSANGLTGKLTLAGTACNTYGKDVPDLDLTIDYQSQQRVLVKIQPSYIGETNKTYYLLPTDVVAEGESASGTIDSPDFEFQYNKSPFWFKIVRKSNNDVVFSTENSKIIFQDQFLEIKTDLPKDHKLFGLGEIMGEWQILPNTTRTLWNADIGDGLSANLYGTHPFYLEERYGDNFNAHGVYLRNAHAHEVLIGNEDLTWRVMGGTLEFYFFAGNSQADVFAQYQDVIGLPAMHQYWTLGLHQCRWGYHNLSEIQDVVTEYRNHDIPLETIWTDIDYMQNYRDFTTDLETFPLDRFKEFLESIHSAGQHYIPIVDAAIYVPNPENASDSYATYDRGHKMDVFVKNPDGSEYIGSVWPGYTVFPDWTAPNTKEWWVSELTEWFKDIEFDGLWIDMDEVSSFCIGSCGSNSLALNPIVTINLSNDPSFDYPDGFKITNSTEWKSLMSVSSSLAAAKATSTASASTSAASESATWVPYNGPVGDDTRIINYPPYAIDSYQSPNELGGHALSPNATHANGYLEFDWHNLFGYQETIMTYDSLSATHSGKRPFVISRSSFPGSGVYGGHWGGDNNANWAWMRYAISQGLSFSMFGIPMFGTDTCGFNGNTDAELCSRWSQMNAFFSFYRNHNGWGYIPQEFYRWSSVEESAKNAIAVRYSLLPYLYTLLENAHERGETYLRALSWEFPQANLSSVATQFLVGPSIMVVPVLEPLVDYVKGVFPGEGTIWYDWYNQTAVDVPANTNVTISAPIGHIPVYVRGGSILPIQQSGYTIQESRQGDWELLVAPDANGEASGDVYIDDGESVTPSSSIRTKFTLSKNKLTVSPSGGYSVEQPLTKVTILGVSGLPNFCDNEYAKFTFNSTTKVLVVDLTTKITLSQGLELNW